jgi:hypothetical protein
MNREQFIHEFGYASKSLGFVPNDEPPWIPPLAGEDCAELKQNGTYFNDRPATLQIVPGKNFPADFSRQQSLRNKYEEARISGSIKLPDLFYETQDLTGPEPMSILVWERPKGKHIIDLDEFMGKKEIPEEKLRETAKMIKNTEKVLAKLSSQPEVMALFSKMSDFDYFIERWHKWITYVQENGPGVFKDVDNEFVEGLKSDIFTEILKEITKGPELEMQLAFNLFGNTDIIKTADGQYYYINGRFEVKPKHFLVAAWLWNLVMYSHQRKSRRFLDDFFCASETLIGTDNFRRGHFDVFSSLKANLLERLFAALTIDFRYRRSPLQDISDRMLQNDIKHITELYYRIV